MGYARPTLQSDLPVLASNMRQEDKQEVFAGLGQEPIEALTFCYQHGKPSMTMVGNNEQPIGIFGVTPDAEDTGLVWMMATDGLLDVQTQFLRQSKGWVDRLNAQYPLLFNYVDARNTVHIKWLKWCGFTFLRLIPVFGHQGIPFYEFVRVSNHV